MPLTTRQKKIIDRFHEEYFRPTPLPEPGVTKITLSEFLDKSRPYQLAFVKEWAIEKKKKRIQTENNLRAQLDRIAVDKQELDEGIADF